MRNILLRSVLITLFIVAVMFVIAVTASPVLAQGPDPTEKIDDAIVSLNVMWTLLAGFLVFFMQAGFALVETGFTRAKNVAHTMMMNMMVFCIGALGYWLTGFAFQFGGMNYTYPEIGPNLPAWSFAPSTLGPLTDASGAPLLAKPLLIGNVGVLGLSGFMLAGLSANFGLLTFFLFQMVFMDTAATIPTGAMAERLKFVGFVLMSLWVSMFIYPLVGGWVWGGGWLANLGRMLGLGNGAVDFAGSGVVHMVGGAVGLAGALVLGPRIGRFNQDGSANVIPAHNIPLGVLGTVILFFGWFGFNPGSALGFTGASRNLAVIAAINTLLAGSAGGVSAMFYSWLVGPSKKPDPVLSVSGILAGLVAITAPCAFVDSWAAVVIGLVAGLIVCWTTLLLEKLKIDDPVGAVPVHFFGGMWGLLAVGIFANGNPDTAMWNGVPTPVTGLLYGGTTQILAQIAEIASIVIVAGGLSFVFFRVLNALGLLRVSRADELAGLDIPEMGVEGYATGRRLLPGMVTGSAQPSAVSGAEQAAR
ncbi:ammonium transporter [Thermoflexus sp.]|uniref:ammonium transporter n=1 Tax=Thermoflexus sp. TaxID=1969742 RepID=UPI0035E420F0